MLALQRANVKVGDVNLQTEPPAPLSVAAQVYWNAVVPALVRAGMFQESDRYMLVELVETYALLVQARAGMNDAILIDGINSKMFSEARTNYVQLLSSWTKLAAEHGLTPTARLRLGLGQIKAATLLDALNEM